MPDKTRGTTRSEDNNNLTMEGYLTHPLYRHIVFLIWITPATLFLGACGGNTAGGGSNASAPATGGSSGSLSRPTPPPTPPSVYAKVRLTWNPSTEPEIAGYYVYHGTSPDNHPDKVWAGNVTRFDYGVFSGGAHYFAITAIDIYGNESQKPTEIYVAVP
jgi:hypothetical protein